MRARLLALVAALGFLLSVDAAVAQASGQVPAVTQQFEARIAAAKAAMMTGPQAALDQATRAEAIGDSLPADAAGQTARATAGWLRGEALVRLGRIDDATPVTKAALQLAEHAAPRSKLVADIYRSQGNMLAATGKVEPAFRDFQIAHSIYRQIGNARGEAMVLQNIGSLYSDAGDNNRVLYYYEQSADVYSGDDQIMMVALNNRAEALKKLGRFKEAWPQYRGALALADKLKSPSLAARILSNLADAQVASGDVAAASSTVDRGLALAKGEGAEWRPFLFGVKARIDLKRGNLASGAQWIAMTFAGADLTKTTVVYRDFHEVAYHIFQGLEDYPKALAHLQAFKRLDDETRALTASTSAALVAANFDFANQNLRIAQLKAGQAVRDAMIAQARERFNLLILSSALGVGAIVLVMLTIGFLSLRRSRDDVRAANESLSRTNAALEAALTAKTQFLATTSHEIRTPLNGILGMTEVILSQRDLDAPLRERLNVVHGAGKTMRALVDDILDVAKMEHGQVVLERDDIALPDLLQDVTRLWETQARAKGVEVKIDLSACPPTMLGDEARLRQIVFNLMSNAVKFTQAGKVCLTAALEAQSVPQLVVTVRDSGIGIPADKLDQIFDAFSQVDGGTTRRFGGTGLGLAIVRNLARAMGGDVTVASEFGAGSSFRLTLPFATRVVTRAPVGELAIDRDAPGGLEACRLLVIERNPLTQSVLGAILRPRLAAVAFAGSTDEAVAQLSATRFDHVVIDLASLDTADPQTALVHLRAQANAAALTLLAPELSAEAFADFVRAGVQRILTKPVTAHALLASLDEIQASQQNLHIHAIMPKRDAA